MKIVVDINHPAHVHFFKNFIWEMEKRGHEILVTASEKEMTYKLLNAYNIKFIPLGSYGKSIFQILINIPIMDYKLLRKVRDFHPDFFLGLGSIRAAHVSKILSKPYIAIEDAEHTKLQNWLYRPFANIILSSYTFKGNYGKKHLKYQGFDELAYLHPKYFNQNNEDLNITKEKYIVIRMVSWATSHDINQSGLNFQSDSDLMDFIQNFEKQGLSVRISSEKKLPDKFEKYSLKTPPDKIHSVLCNAEMYIGEGATMAAEAAVLGIPSIYVSTISLGYISELKEKFELVYTCLGYKNVITLANELLRDKTMKERHKRNRERLLTECIDPTNYLVKLVESCKG